MALRLLLVSMVAGMGLSLPTAHDLEEWNHKAHAIWVAGLEQWDSLMPTGIHAFAEEPRPALAPIVVIAEVEPELVAYGLPYVNDIQFEAIVEVMAARFAAETVPVAVATISQVEVIALPAEADQQDLPAEVFAHDVGREAAGDGYVEVIPTMPAPSVNSKGVSHALQLTREAASAWVSLLGSRTTTIASVRQ